MNDDRKLIPFTAALRRPDPARVAAFAETARRLKRERIDSEDIVMRLLGDTPRAQWPRLRERSELRNSGALEKLGQEVEKRRQVHPAESLALAEVATAIADALPQDSYPAITLAQCRSRAWKDRGQTLSYLGRYDEAFHALDIAERHLDDFGMLAHDHAIVRFARAVTLQETNRFDESLTILKECRMVFAGYGDVRRCLLCGIAEGTLLQRQHRYREAREIYLPLLDVASTLADEESPACLHNLLGHCYVSLHDFESAEPHLREAVHRFNRIGQPLAAAKAELARGRLLMHAGQHARAVQHLARTRDVFLRHDLIEEAGLCGLDMVESLLAQAAAAPAETLVRRIVEEFTIAKLNARAIVALGYLTDVIATRDASRKAVDTVRDYILSLRKDPEREFIRLA